jgi:hypothetical protein
VCHRWYAVEAAALWPSLPHLPTPAAAAPSHGMEEVYQRSRLGVDPAAVPSSSRVKAPAAATDRCICPGVAAGDGGGCTWRVGVGAARFGRGWDVSSAR